MEENGIGDIQLAPLEPPPAGKRNDDSDNRDYRSEDRPRGGVAHRATGYRSHTLEREHIKEIIEIQLRGLLKRLSDRKITVELTDRGKDFLVREGYDPVYGARPLKRALQRFLLDPLALRVLEGAFREGDTVTVDMSGDALSFAKKGQPVHA